MKIGTGTYTYFWRIAAAGGDPGILDKMLEECSELGAEVFQICDFAPLESFDDGALRRLRHRADELGIELELGTRGIDPAHLDRYRRMALVLGVRFVRTILSRAGEAPDLSAAARQLRTIMAGYRQSEITLGLETYEQVSLDDTLRLIAQVGEDHLGICLDPGNSIAAFEMPDSLIQRAAPHVVNVHVKDFGFARREGGQGFTLTGRALGNGSLDLDRMVDAVTTFRPDVNLILEHWVPWQEDQATTLALEQEWTAHGMRILRQWAAHRS